MKIGYVLLDGAADRPIPKLNFTTPLEAAYTPNLDSIARESLLGRVVTVGRGIAPESDIAVFSMLGYSFRQGYPGRGVVEAVGAGVRFQDGDVAFRTNFASVEGGRIVDRRAGRNLTWEDAKRLEEDLKAVSYPDVEFEFQSTVSYRGVLVVRSNLRISAEVSNTDPAYIRVGGFGAARETGQTERVETCRPESRDERARRTARYVNEFVRQAFQILERSEVNKDRVRRGILPANALLLRDAGDHLPEPEKFQAKYGMRGVALVEMPVEVGIAKLLGLKIVRVEDKDALKAKARLFDKELREGTIVYAHIKGPDEFGHDGDAVGKKMSIERIDRDFFSTAAKRVGDARLAVSSDHATPCTLKRHSADLVPLLISGKRGGSRFTERASRKGGLGTLLGTDVLRKVISL